ncbi:hypothetical protein ACM9HB_20285, partial [Streptomyces sp. JAC128]
HPLLVEALYGRLVEHRLRAERGRGTGAGVARGPRGGGQGVPDAGAAAERSRGVQPWEPC